MNEITIQDVAMAALLHDIGKIYIRAYRENKQMEILEKNRELFELYPEVDRIRHTIYGYEMVEKLNFSDFVKTSILHHHTTNPTNQLVKLISIADRISSAERVNDYSDSPYKSFQLISVFSEINPNNKKNLYKPLLSLLETLQSEQYLFETPLPIEQAKLEYKTISQKLIKNLELCYNNFEDILFLYREYASNIPSAYYYSKPTISLFAHSLSTAAIATSLFSQFYEDIKNQNFEFLKMLSNELDKNYSDQKFLGLIKADISGIQNFIFNTSYDKALKQLKGKSFYLELLMELFARYIVYSEGLTLANVLMIGGGHFYLLTPSKTIDNLDKYKKSIEKLMYKTHKNQVSLVLTGIRVSLPQLKSFSKLFQEINTIHEENKYRKNETIVLDQEFEFFEPKPSTIDNCPHCERFMNSDNCEFCDSFSDLATKLSKNTYLHLYKIDNLTNGHNIDSVYQVFESLGFYIDFSNQEIVPNEISLKDNNKAKIISSFKIKQKHNIQQIFKKYLTIANYIPLNKNNEIKTLSDISQESQGIKRWGILKGDVDNLGKTFQNISKADEASSLSKTVTLSLELKTFFSIFVERIVEERYPECIIVYSGGDDFLIIGPYDRLYVLARDLENEFRKFTGGNLTLSMSFVIAVNEKHPVFRVATEADDYLEKAKNESPAKNSINILSKTIKWSSLPKFDEIVQIIVDIIKKDGGSKAILNYLFNASKYKDYKIVPSWRLFYKLHNYKSRYTRAGENIDKLKDLIYKKEGNKIYENTYEATKLADYLSR
ncbi:MAG: type III-A CRISPR-associated protein Cas10/Csm1 [Candidatus Calescibacterium sp.]|nr:type III-A CRISPR-associated protein Cas10/Csm1 [Candidatus Calescibacterium sp.]MDW8133151.1 type III-A CRISPR-associated protein Cas10/Csm1 [Candidatus Calescibacterium sp.]